MTRGPLPRRTAWRAVVRCVGSTAVLLAQRRLHQPRDHVGRVVRFADGSHARVYRETVADVAPADPCVLVVMFRLRGVHGRGHVLFRVESILNTPLFAGFPGFVSKLWCAHDEHEAYRGVYEWDGPAAAESYARSLWRVLELVSEPGSIDYRVVPGVRRDQVLAYPGLLDVDPPVADPEADPAVNGVADPDTEAETWWRVVATS